MATLGDIAIGLRMDSSKFSAGAQHARKDVGLLGKVFGSVTGQIAGLAAGALGMFSVFKAATWGGSMALEAERSSIAFEVMLGSADKAAKMLKQIETFASQSPYDLEGTRSAAQLLLNYGVAADSVMPVLGMIGDIASGDAQKLHGLAVAFGQSSATGRLMGQDLNQMINAGFNPLQEISKRTGESMAALKTRMEAGGVSTGEVTQAFQDATSEGGRFYGMMDKQSGTTLGLFSSLKDNVGLALADIAAALMDGFDIKGLFAGGIEATTAFRDNITAWLPTFTQIGGAARWLWDTFVAGLKIGGQWLDWLIKLGLSMWPIFVQVWHMISEAGAAAWEFVYGVAFLAWTGIQDIVSRVFLFFGATTNTWRTDLLTALLLVEFGFKNLGAICTLLGTMIALKFVETGNVIAYTFTTVLPSLFGTALENGMIFFSNLAGYAKAVFVDLASNIGGVLADLWEMATGGEATHEWKAVGSGFKKQEMVGQGAIPEREQGPIEKELAASVKSQKEGLAGEWGKFHQERMAEFDKAGMATTNYMPGGPTVPSGPDLPGRQSLDTKPTSAAKAAGAIGVGSKDYFSSIFQRMDGGKRLEKHAANTAKTSQETATAVKQINQRDKQPPKVVQNFGK